MSTSLAQSSCALFYISMNMYYIAMCSSWCSHTVTLTSCLVHKVLFPGNVWIDIDIAMVECNKLLLYILLDFADSWSLTFE